MAFLWRYITARGGGGVLTPCIAAGTAISALVPREVWSSWFGRDDTAGTRASERSEAVASKG